MRIGDQFSKFIYSATIPIPKIKNWQEYVVNPLNLVKLQDFRSGRGEEALGAYNFRFRHGEVYDQNDWVDIVLASCISSLEYTKYVNENEP